LATQRAGLTVTNSELGNRQRVTPVATTGEALERVAAKPTTAWPNLSEIERLAALNAVPNWPTGGVTSRFALTPA
jgi:hypothetical protein